jgi:NhaP-type Na+/H+ or K+/H+ antiporter
MAETFTLIAVLLSALLLYSLIANKLKGSIITPPMIFLVIGLVVSPIALGVLDFEENRELILLYAEIALVIALFSDAATVDFKSLRKNRWPALLLTIGLPLTIGLGMVLALVTFAGLTLGEAGLIGAILAPTDAALGQAILHNEHVPARIRQTLDVESGLNDGGAVPFFALFLLLAQVEGGQIPASEWIIFTIEQIGFGIVVGLIVGFVGATLINSSMRKGWISPRRRPIALVCLALIAFFLADIVGGSGFIAAYIGGLAVAAYRGDITEELIEYTGVEGEALSLGVFFILGLIFASFVDNITWLIVIYAILSLTIARILPVWVSLIRTKLSSKDKLFIGWFGPRGLASIVLVIIALSEAESIPGLAVVVTVVLVTVVISVFAHGITAAPIARRLYSNQEK